MLVYIKNLTLNKGDFKQKAVKKTS